MQTVSPTGSSRLYGPAETLGVLCVLVFCGLLLPLMGVRVTALTLAGLVFAAALVWFRTFLWLTLVFVLPFSLELAIPQLGGKVTLPSEVLVVALLAAHVAFCILRMRVDYLRSPLNLPVAAYLLMMWLTLWASSDWLVSLKAVVRDTGYLLVGYYMVTRLVRTRRTLLLLCAGMVTTCTLAGLYGMGTQVREGFRIYAAIGLPFFPEHCIYAAYLAIFAGGLLTALVAIPTAGMWRVMGWALLTILLVAIGLSFVRGAWLSLLAVAAVLVLVCWHRFRPSFIIVGGLLAIVFLGVVGYLELQELFSQRLGHAFSTSYVTNYDRIDRWMTAFNMWSENPVLGVGWGRYPDEYRHYYHFLNAYSTELRMGAHNLYLEILAEAGLVGLLIFLWLLASAGVEVARLWRQLTDPVYRGLVLAVGMGLLTLAVHMVVNNLGPSDKIQIVFWMLLGLLPTIAWLARHEPDAEPESDA